MELDELPVLSVLKSEIRLLRDEIDAKRRDERVGDVWQCPRGESEGHGVRAVLEFVLVAVQIALEGHVELADRARVEHLHDLLHPREDQQVRVSSLHQAMNALIDVEVSGDHGGQRADAGRLGRDQHRLRALKTFLQKDEVLVFEPIERLRRDLGHSLRHHLERSRLEELHERRLRLDRLDNVRDALLGRVGDAVATQDHEVRLSEVTLFSR